MPEISIITPCYNAAKYLPETVKSVTDQTFADWEWIIVDDQSADASADFLKNLSDPRIKPVFLEKNGGAGHARNVALERATGRYITFLDADDWWAPTFLEEMLAFMKAENCELAYSNYSRCDAELQPILADFTADKPVTFRNMLRTCRLSLLSTMYDSQRVGKEYFPTGSRREDHVMWLNLLKKIPQGLPLNRTLAKYRMLENSVSRDKKKIVREQYLVYRQHMGYSILASLYYTANWAFNGFLKYSKIFN